MTHQTTFAHAEFAGKKKTTRREKFLARMEEDIPWAKLLEIKEIEGSVATFERQFRSQITDQIKRMRDNILRDIREEITKRSKSEGYTLVLDTAGESVNQTPLVIYQAGLPDITNDVLTAVNKDAPAGSLTPATEEKK